MSFSNPCFSSDGSGSLGFWQLHICRILRRRDLPKYGTCNPGYSFFRHSLPSGKSLTNVTLLPDGIRPVLLVPLIHIDHTHVRSSKCDFSKSRSPSYDLLCPPIHSSQIPVYSLWLPNPRPPSRIQRFQPHGVQGPTFPAASSIAQKIFLHILLDSQSKITWLIQNCIYKASPVSENNRCIHSLRHPLPSPNTVSTCNCANPFLIMKMDLY